LQAKAAAGDAVVVEKAATRLKVNSADAKEAGRRNRATMVTDAENGRWKDGVGVGRREIDGAGVDQDSDPG